MDSSHLPFLFFFQIIFFPLSWMLITFLFDTHNTLHISAFVFDLCFVLFCYRGCDD